MEKKIVGICICMLMIGSALPAVGAVNVQPVLPSSQGLIGIRITARVIEVHDTYNLLDGRIKVDDVITGKYVYDSGVSDSFPSSNKVGLYVFSSSSCYIEIKAGGFSFKTNPNDMDFYIDIRNDYFDDISDVDSYYVRSNKNLQLSNGMSVKYIWWFLKDKSCTALSSDALPTTAPKLDDWKDTNLLTIEGNNPTDPGKTYSIRASVTSAIKSKSVDVTATERIGGSHGAPSSYVYTPTYQLFFVGLFQRFPNAFPILRHLMGY
jgi:hypothetical protein